MAGKLLTGRRIKDHYGNRFDVELIDFWSFGFQFG